MKIRHLKGLALISVLLFFACTANINEAVLKGNLNGVVSVINKDKSKIYFKDQDGSTLLHLAVFNDHIDIVKYLVSQGVDVNAQDSEGDTPLHLAASSGYLEVAKYLVSKGANVNATNKSFQETPLHRTSYYGYIDMVKLLVNHGADVNALAKDKSTPLQNAAAIGSLHIVRFLISKGAKLNHIDKVGDTALHRAVGNRHLKIVKELVYQGVDINVKDKFGNTPLHLAVRTGKFEIVKYLITQGADVNVSGECFSGYLPLAKEFGCTPLHGAATIGYLEIVKYLLSHGADINAKTRKGNTPLHAAVKASQLEVVEYLTSREVDVGAKNNAGETAYQLAINIGYTQISDYLSPLDKLAKRYQSPQRPLQKKTVYKKPRAKTTSPETINYFPGIDFGNYHALVIGNDNYRSLPKLLTARNDARTVAQILQNNYGYRVKLMLDADRAQIVTALANLRKRLSRRDNLLIYYAGHGWLDKEADEGYWLPVDAESDNPINWLSNSSITAVLRALEAKHVLIVADSCYSGKLGRGLHIRNITPSYLTRIAGKKARSVLSSGGVWSR
jgi:ankyrin repeat protein